MSLFQDPPTHNEPVATCVASVLPLAEPVSSRPVPVSRSISTTNYATYLIDYIIKDIDHAAPHRPRHTWIVLGDEGIETKTEKMLICNAVKTARNVTVTWSSDNELMLTWA